MRPPSFFENLRNAPADLMREAKRVLAPSPKEAPPAMAGLAKEERLARIEKMNAVDRAESAKKAEAIRARWLPPAPVATAMPERAVSMAEMDEFLRGPIPGREIAPRVRTSAERPAAPSLERQQARDRLSVATGAMDAGKNLAARRAIEAAAARAADNLRSAR